MAKIVVTGVAGFIGSHVCDALLERGDRVVGIDNFDTFYDPAVKRANLQQSLSSPAFALVEGDIRDAGLMTRVMAGVDAVVHLAARAGVRPSIEQPVLYQDVNVGGTTILLEAAKNAGVRRFVLASSSSVYGNNEKVPFSETDNVDFPISPYAATKKACELIAHAFVHLHDISVTCLRFFTVYGPRQRPDLAIHKFTRLIEEGRPIPVFGDGGTMRDYTFIGDAVPAVLAAIDRCSGYGIYNIGGSRPLELRQLIAEIESAIEKKARIDRLPMQPGDVERTYADISRAQRDLDYTPATSIGDGLTEFVRWYRSPR